MFASDKELIQQYTMYMNAASKRDKGAIFFLKAHKAKQPLFNMT